MDDLISRQEALNIRFSDAINEDGVLYVPLRDFTNGLKALPSAQPEYYDYSDINDVWEFYAEEQNINLTDGAKQLKDAMWVGYRKGKQDAQPTADVVEVVRCRYCKHRDTNECPYDTVNYMLADSDFCSSGERADT